MDSRRACAVGLLASAGMLALASAQETVNQPTSATAQMSVDVQRGRVTASIQNSPLHEVLEELSGRTGVALVPGAGVEADQVSAELKDVPLDEGLRQLLKDYDAFFYYGAAGQNTRTSLRAVWVYPRGAAATVRPVPPATWASTKDLETGLADRDPAIREQAYDALMSRPDRESRNRVLLALRGATETDYELRQRLLSSALSKGVEVPFDLLADLVRGDGSEEIRVIALDALAGEPAARNVAVTALSDPSEAVRDRAGEFLAEIEGVLRRDSGIR
jgi:hypothetical protein